MSIEYDIAFLPAGAMNTALAVKLRENGHEPILWCHTEESLRYIQENDESKALPGVKLRGMYGTTDLKEALEGKKMVFFTPRSWDLRALLRRAAPYIESDAILVCGTKGLDEYRGQYYTPSQVIEQEVPDSRKRLAILAGPNFAKQIATGVITGTVVAAYSRETAQIVKDLFNHHDGSNHNDFLVSVYKGKPVSVEAVAAFKNVVGLVMGFARTLATYGENTGAFILKEGLYEATLLCKAMKCDPNAILELCGIGDYGLLMNSLSSRNVEAGYRFGMGEWTMDYLKDPDHTFEGVRTVKAVRELAGKRIALMPLVAYAYKIIYEGMDSRMAVEDLLAGKFPKI